MLRLCGTTIAAGFVAISCHPPSARAQTLGAFPPPGWHAPHVKIEARHRPRNGGAVTRSGAVEPHPAYRGLTINRPPDDVTDDDRAGVFVDGNTRYGDIRSFNPAPYVTSGTQLPYGLDGIGGYGSDLGFEAGEDAAVYQRGP